MIANNVINISKFTSKLKIFNIYYKQLNLIQIPMIIMHQNQCGRLKFHHQ